MEETLFVCLSDLTLWISALLLFFDLWRFLPYAQLAAPKEALQPSCTRILMGMRMLFCLLANCGNVPSSSL
jgi:hypothetical protein